MDLRLQALEALAMKNATAAASADPARADRNGKDKEAAPGWSPQQVHERDVKTQQGFERLFESEARDGAWTSEVGSAVHAAFAAAPSGRDGVAVVGVSCGQTLCRMELQSPPGVPREDLSSIALMKLPPRTTIWASIDEALGPGRTLMFVTKPGEPLPSDVMNPP